MAFILNDEIYRRALVSTGDAALLNRFRRLVAAGKPIVYGAIGGSITSGASATTSGNRYVSRIAFELQNRTACKLVNAGIGATDSRYGAMRCEEHLLRHAPDLITIEFAVNDIKNPDYQASYEGLLRRCRQGAPDALIILLFTLRDDGFSRQDDQIPAGRHYNLAMLSYHNAVWPAVQAGEIAWSDIAPDNVHPNDIGQQLIADMVLRLLFEEAAAPEELPAPLCPESADFETGRVVPASRLAISANNGWTFENDRLVAEKPGSELTFQFTGSDFHFGFVKYAGDRGLVAISIDGEPERLFDSYFEAPGDWRGGHTFLEEIARHRENGPHSVRVRLLPERHPKSGGHRFEISYSLCR